MDNKFHETILELTNHSEAKHIIKALNESPALQKYSGAKLAFALITQTIRTIYESSDSKDDENRNEILVKLLEIAFVLKIKI